MTRLTIFVLIIATGVFGWLDLPVGAQARNFEPITDAELFDPDPKDWINWRRTLDGQGYSPLNQINRDNVKNLQLVWSFETPPGTDEVTPLVHDGVMYIPGRSGVVALDAMTGDEIWAHLKRQPLPADDSLPSNQRPGLAPPEHRDLRQQDLRRNERGAARGARCPHRQGRVGAAGRRP